MAVTPINRMGRIDGFRTSDGKTFSPYERSVAERHERSLNGTGKPAAQGVADDGIAPENRRAMLASVAKTKAKREAEADVPLTIEGRRQKRLADQAAEKKRLAKFTKERRKLENQTGEEAERAARLYGRSTPNEGDPTIDERAHRLAVDRQNRSMQGNPNRPQPTVS